MAVSLYDDPADDYERNVRDDGRRTVMFLCVECRGYMPRERLPGERDGGFLCDECCGPKATMGETR